MHFCDGYMNWIKIPLNQSINSSYLLIPLMTKLSQGSNENREQKINLCIEAPYLFILITIIMVRSKDSKTHDKR